MLNVIGLNGFYYLIDFQYVRCEYNRVRSVIHRQFDREPEEGDVFIMISKTVALSACTSTTVVAVPFMKNVSGLVTSL